MTAGALTPPGATEGQAFGNMVVFHFTDGDSAAMASDNTATVNTGDATLTSTANPGNVQIVANPNGGFDVLLSYTYAEEFANANFSVQVADPGGQTIGASQTISVADAPLSAGALTPPTGTGTPTVSTFVDNTHGLGNPYGLAFDGSGNLYVADIGNNSISKVTPAGVVSTFVDSTRGLSNPYGLAFDGSGNLYVANFGNNTISKVTPAGVVSTFVDNTHGLGNPQALTFDASGNLFTTNSGNGTISKVTPGGVVSTFVDNTHGLSDPTGLAFDASGNLYVANHGNNTISKVTPFGVVSTFVDNTHGLSAPAGLAFSANGNLYVTDGGNAFISKVTPAGVVSTYLDNTHGLSGGFGLACDGSGNLYAANGAIGTISKVTPPPLIEGQAFATQTVFHFTDADAFATAADYTAVVTLGDGKTVSLNSSGMISGPAGAAGQIVASGNGFDVQLSYTYAEELANGTFGVLVTDHNSQASSSIGNFNVADAALYAPGIQMINPVFDTPFSGELTTFVDANPDATLADFPLANVTIQWGDGQTSTATAITQPGGPGTPFHVFGSHTYGVAGALGSFLGVTITDVDGSVSNTTSTFVTVANASTTTTLTDTSPLTYGTYETLTATVAAYAPPIGTVTFNEVDSNNNILCMFGTSSLATVSGQQQASLTFPAAHWDKLDVGTYHIEAVYNPATGFSSSTSSSIGLIVTPGNFNHTIGNDSQTYGSPANLATDLGTTFATGYNGENLVITYASSGDAATAPVGSYAITGVVSNGTGLISNYNLNLTNGTLTVDRATATVVVTPYTVTYDGRPHTATVTSITGVNGETGATVGSVTLNTTHTNAGTYANDMWSFSGSNYKDIAATTITDVIGKANATITVTPYNVLYDALAHTTTGTAQGVLRESLSGLGLAGTTHTNAGTYTDTWTFTDTTGNYNNASGTVIDRIYKPVAKGETATIGFWHNKNGQALINSLNGGSKSTLLASWLATTFSNLYGATAGIHSMLHSDGTPLTNSEVAALYLTSSFFRASGQKTDAQILSVALAAYVTSTDLAGPNTTAGQYGFIVSADGTGGQGYNVGTNGAAFGVANNTTPTIFQLLFYTNSQSSHGLLYNGNATYTGMANTIYGGINQTGDIT